MKKLLLAMAASMLLAGCTPRIEIAASKEPITINMKVRIRQENYIKGEKEVENLLKTLGELFGGDEEQTTVNRGADAGFTQRARAGVDPGRGAPAGTSGGDAERLSRAAASG